MSNVREIVIQYILVRKYPKPKNHPYKNDEFRFLFFFFFKIKIKNKLKVNRFINKKL